MAHDYSATPQGSAGSGGLGGGTGAGQSGGTWSAQPSFPQPQYPQPQYPQPQNPQPLYPPYDAPYEAQRAFAVTAAPAPGESPSRSPHEAGYAAGNAPGSAPSNVPGMVQGANGASGVNAGGALGTLVIRPLPTEEGGQTREIVLNGRDVAIGRSPACDVVLEADQLVSRRHALLRYNGSHYTIVDLGSSNGTYVNEVEIHGNTPLNDGDLITIGEHEVLFSTRPAALAAGIPAGTQATPAIAQGTGSGGFSGGLSSGLQSGGPTGQGTETPAWASQRETAPQLAPGSVPASELFDIAAAHTLLEPQGRPEPAWTQPAPQQFTGQQFAGQPAQPAQPAATPQQGQQQPQPASQSPQVSVQSSPQVQPPSAQPPAQPYAQQPYSSPYQAAYPSLYQAPAQPGTSPSTPSAAQTASQPQGAQPAGQTGAPLVAPGGSTSSARNTSAYLRAVRAQLDEANQRLAQAEEEESRLAEQRRAALLEVRDRLNAILAEQGRATGGSYGSAYGAGTYAPTGNPNLNSLISLARDTAENPRQIDYMMQLAGHASEIASALETAQNTPAAPARGGTSGLLAQLDALRARIDELIG